MQNSQVFPLFCQTTVCTLMLLIHFSSHISLISFPSFQIPMFIRPTHISRSYSMRTSCTIFKLMDYWERVGGDPVHQIRHGRLGSLSASGTNATASRDGQVDLRVHRSTLLGIHRLHETGNLLEGPIIYFCILIYSTVKDFLFNN